MSRPDNPAQLYSLLYCRVSSKRQVQEGNGLDSQEKRCHDRSDSRGYIFEKAFPDEGISGSLFDRPAMKAMIAYIDAHQHKNFVVIFDDLKRFARDYIVHLKIKAELVSRGVKLECLNFNFEDSDENEFIEGVLALQAQLERKQNRRQVIQKQKARLERGFWAFCSPLGLKTVKTKQDGKVLQPAEPYASIFKEAIQGYEKNIFVTQEEVRQFVNREYYQHGIQRKISIHGVQEMLKSPLYAGYVEYLPWGVERREGHHTGIISPETFQNVQDKIAGRTKLHLRKDYTLDFPLRGWTLCAACGQPLTASWVTGRSKRYPVYSCHCLGCPYRYKSIQRSKIEPEFETILATKKIPADVGNLVKVIFTDVWREQKLVVANDYQMMTKQVRELDNKIMVLAERVSAAKTEVLVTAYESQIEKLAEEKALVESKSKQPHFTEKQFGTALDSVLKTLENPLLLWNSDQIEDKRTIQYMYFDEPPQYAYETGFGTVRFGESINLFSSFDSANTPDVEMRGNEPLSVNTIKSKFSRQSKLFGTDVGGKSHKPVLHHLGQSSGWNAAQAVPADTLTELSPIARRQ